MSRRCPCCNKSLMPKGWSAGGWCEWCDCVVEDGRITRWPTVLVVPRGFLCVDRGEASDG